MDDLLAPFRSRVRRLVELREERDTSKVAAERAEKEYREAEAELWDDIQESGLKGSLAFDLGGDLGTIRIHANETFYGRVIDEEKALDYFENAGLVESHTTQKIVGRRLNELVRGIMEDDKAILPEGIDFRANRYITISRR